MKEKKITNKKEIKKGRKNREKGITLVALIVTIVLNCYRSGRNLEYAM